jgi:hypothetical protein
MKKAFSIWSMVVLTTLCVGFSSCSDDDDESSIIGLWVFVNLTADIENPTDPEAEKDEQEGIVLSSILLQGTTIDLKADKSLVFTVMGKSRKGTYKEDGSQFIITLDDDTTVNPGDIISTIASGSSISLKDGILTLTSNNLDDRYDTTPDGEIITYREVGFTKHTAKLTFKK